MRTLILVTAILATGCGAARDYGSLVADVAVEFSPAPVEGSTMVSYPGNGPLNVLVALPAATAAELELRARVAGVDGAREPSVLARGDLPAGTLVNGPTAYVDGIEQTRRGFRAAAYSERQPLLFSVQAWIQVVDPSTGQVHAGPVQSRAFCVRD